ncbi:ABC transporter substrate-binding protein [Anaerobacillus alkalilacustris]|uniref:ABC transporter substrate-binding protein n=1 Tax=Anaerobacillus alkalilacustris TaxID=393763 RepID=A0A1S2LRJ1_9BACI|nr:ABC transporter substrate-binding protein [Anaerobacillus alkalilacustris]OIJ15131.1 ABC transporter substrate-binding protein [Anaerobacillus alkalilacustris]
MKKWLIVLIFALVFCLAVFAFAFGKMFFTDSEEIVDDKNTIDQIELTFWRNSGNEAFNKAYEELVADFEAAHPKIVINMQTMNWANEYELRLRTELAAGNYPDIMTIDSPTLALYANSGALLSIDQYMKEEGNIDDISQPTLKGLTFEGEFFLAPITEPSIALFYNRYLFKEAGIPFPSADPDNPLTWDEVLDIALQITNIEKGVYGIDPAQGFSEGEGPAYFKLPILWQFGAEALSPDGTTADRYLNSDEALEALQFYQDLYHKHQVATVELPSGAFETGKLAMTILGSWHLSELEGYTNFTLGEDFGIAPLPKGKYQVAPNGGWALGISSRTNYPDEAWEFIKFMTSYEGIKKFVEITGEIPARYSVANDIAELNEYPKNIFVQQGQKYSKNRPVTPAYSVVSHSIKLLFEDVGMDGKDVEAAAVKAVERIDRGIEELLESSASIVP